MCLLDHVHSQLLWELTTAGHYVCLPYHQCKCQVLWSLAITIIEISVIIEQTRKYYRHIVS
jgi:hypothetical protein